MYLFFIQNKEYPPNSTPQICVFMYLRYLDMYKKLFF